MCRAASLMYHAGWGGENDCFAEEFGHRAQLPPMSLLPGCQSRVLAASFKATNKEIARGYQRGKTSPREREKPTPIVHVIAL